MTKVLLYRGHGARASIILQWRSSGPYCSTDTHANRRHRCSVYIRPRMRPTDCPRRLTNITADSPVHTGLPHCGRFTRDWFQLHTVIINFMAGYFRPKRIRWYPSKSIFGICCFCKKNNYVGFAYFYIQDIYWPQHWCYTMHMERAPASLYTGFWPFHTA